MSDNKEFLKLMDELDRIAEEFNGKQRVMAADAAAAMAEFAKVIGASFQDIQLPQIRPPTFPKPPETQWWQWGKYSNDNSPPPADKPAANE